MIVELHGDWRTATRLYGSPLRRGLSPVADAVGAFGLRRADAVRTVSTYTSDLVREVGVEPAREFAAFMDLELFLERPPAPLPERPAALFVGVLELYKNVDGLARAWRLAAPRVPGAQLRIVGRGTQREVVEQLVRDLPEQTTWVERLTQAEVAAALDDATCLVLPSRSEGLGRVLVESFLRGRPAVAMGIGGITDVVTDDVDGLLVQSDEQLADALVRVLTDRPLAAAPRRQRRDRAASAGSRPRTSSPTASPSSSRRLRKQCERTSSWRSRDREVAAVERCHGGDPKIARQVRSPMHRLFREGDRGTAPRARPFAENS